MTYPYGSIVYGMGYVNCLKSRTPTPQASYHPPRKGKRSGPSHPVGGHLPPEGIGDVRAAIQGSGRLWTVLALPRHHRTQHP